MNHRIARSKAITSLMYQQFFAARFLTAGLDRDYAYWQEELPRVPSLEFPQAPRRCFLDSSRAHRHC